MGTDRSAAGLGPELPQVCGRVGICEELSSLIDSIVHRDRSALVLRGPAGIGKTHLLRWTIANATRRAIRTATIRPTASLPTGGNDVFAILCEQLGLHAPSEPITTSRGLIEAARALDDAIGDRGVLIAVDDLSLLPAATRSLLMDLLRLTTGALGFLAADRGDANDERPLSGLDVRGDLPATALHLDGLDRAGIAAFAASHLGGPVLPSLVDALERATRGHPLGIIETLRRWRIDRALDEVGGRWTLAPDGDRTAPVSLEELAGRQISDLSDPELRVARTLAIFNRPTPAAAIADAGELTVAEAGRALQTLERIGWIAAEPRTPTLYDYTHATFRAAVLDRTDQAARAQIHHGIVGARPPHLSSVELADHAVRSLEPPPDLDALLDKAAAEASALGDSALVARYQGLIAERCADDPARWATARLAQARALRGIDPQQALEVYQDVSERAADEPTRGSAAVERGELLTAVGRRDEGTDLLRAAIGSATGQTRETYEIRLASLLLGLGQSEEARALLEPAAARDRPLALGLMAMFPFQQGALAEAADLLQRGLAAAESRSERMFLRDNLAWCEIFLGRWQDAAETLAAAIDDAETANATVRALRLRAAAITLSAWRGDHEAALDQGWRTLHVARALAPPLVVADVTNAVAAALIEAGSTREGVDLLEPLLQEEFAPIALTLGEAATEIQDLSLAERCQAIAEQRLGHDPTRAVSIDRLRARTQLAAGDVAAAVATLEPWEDSPSVVVFEQARAMHTLVDALWRARQRPRARALAETVRETYDGLGARARRDAIDAWIAEHRIGRPRRRDANHMTEREREVITLAVEGYTNAEIAERLILSPATVKKHMQNVYARTGVKRRAELYRIIRP